MILAQCKLQSDKTELVTYLDSISKLKVGYFVTLKDSDEPERKWKILSIGKPTEFSDIKIGGKTSKRFYRHDFIKDDSGCYQSCK